MWLQDRYTLVVQKGYQPQVEDVTQLIKSMDRGGWGNSHAEKDATQLLGSSGERAMHEELERKLTAELAGRVGGELEVTVSIKPKST